MSAPPNIDWPAVHQQLDEGARLVDSAFAPAHDRVDEILAARAAQLAQRKGSRTVTETHQRTVLLLQVGDHTAGIEAQWIKEVLRLTQDYAPVPDAHALLQGVINVHNQLVNLVDPWPLLHESRPTAAIAFPHAVLLRHAHLRVAIGCSRVTHLVSLPEAAWQSDRLFLFSPEEPPAVMLDIQSLLQLWESHTLRPL